MIFLILSILVSSLIFVIFRVFPKLKVDTFQAIVFNYFTACAFGFIFYGNEFRDQALIHTNWIPYVLLCGTLFICLFLILALSSQKNGLLLTSVSLKMSLAMTMLLMIIWYGEPLTFTKIIGIILAIIGILLISWVKTTKKSESKPVLWMLALLFIGSGVLDFTLNFVQGNFKMIIPTSIFCSIGFGIAGCIGLLILIIQIVRKKTQFHFRSLLAGIGLGIPNYFSIYLLMESYSAMKPWADSTVLAITNVSIVLLSAFYGFILFKEKFSVLKGFGLIVSLGAIIVLYFASFK